MNPRQKRQTRRLHRTLAPILFIPFLATALTGTLYRVGRTWLGLSNDAVEWTLWIHEGRFLGAPLVPVYVLLLGLGVAGLIATGWTMVRRRAIAIKPRRFDARHLHAYLAPVASIPLLVSAVTGIGFRCGKAWLGFPPEVTQWLLRVHQGTYLGPQGRTVYVLLVGIGAVALLVTGIQLTGVWRRSRPAGP